MENTTASESLLTTGVLTMEDGEVKTTDHFEFAVEEYTEEAAALSPEELSDSVKDRIGREAVVEPFVDLCSEDPRTVAELFALYDHLNSTADDAKPLSDDWLSLLPVLRLFRPLEIPTDGVPESFIPVPARHVPHLTRIYSPAVVYVWLNDCLPCDAMKADLESVFEEPQDVMPFAVYGPEYREFLANEYEVTAGPALLFIRDGTVDSRLYGAQGSRTIEAELVKFRELVTHSRSR